MTQTERRRFLLSRLLAEAPEYRQLAVPDDAAGQKQLLRALLNVRPPRDASPEFLQVQDEYLRAELTQKGVTVPESLTPAARCGEAALYLWQGDITTLQCDAIPSDQRATLISVDSMAYSLLMIPASPLVGAVGDAFGQAGAGLALLGGLVAVSGLVLLGQKKR